jgi:hypothetical protein
MLVCNKETSSCAAKQSSDTFFHCSKSIKHALDLASRKVAGGRPLLFPP